MSKIDLYSVGDLLDTTQMPGGRHFFIPAYQRGYRWGKLQMEDLLDDLFEFALRKGKKTGEFYCLQPIIVQQVVDDEKLEKIRVLSGWEDITRKNTWEVVDGQQRLTSIYIIYRYLIEKGVADEEEQYMKLYSLCYETHPDTKKFLELLTKESVNKWKDIDEKHIAEAYNWIGEWFKTNAVTIARRLEYSDLEKKMATRLCNLLNCKKNEVAEETGSAQFIWYELQSDNRVNPIDEFLTINTGKIPLTDAELIKALFLQKKNFTSETMKIGKPEELALQWETIENSLHRDDFWQFISAKGEDSDNRIELLFRLRYQQTHNGNKPDNGELFRYFYNDIWNGKAGIELQKTVLDEWGQLYDLYNLIESWYEDPVYYNYIGFLIHAGSTLFDIKNLYDEVGEDKENSEFMEKIKKKIAKMLPSEEDVRNREITLSYGKSSDHYKIRSLLLFLNVNQLNAQIEALREKGNDKLMAPIYKFPFDLFVSQKWDIEHIDSATENDLSREEDKEAWVKNSLPFLSDNEQKEINSIIGEGKDYSSAMLRILQMSRDDDETAGDEDIKDSIGNLTLLDAETNRSYHNVIFARKRLEIVKVIKEGRFVPLCTQLVFNKNFDDCDTDLRKWKKGDKLSYQEFIIKQLEKFYKINVNDGEQKY